jgi:hypothetical protein
MPQRFQRKCIGFTIQIDIQVSPLVNHFEETAASQIRNATA